MGTRIRVVIVEYRGIGASTVHLLFGSIARDAVVVRGTMVLAPSCRARTTVAVDAAGARATMTVGAAGRRR